MAILRNDQVKHQFRQTLPDAAGKEDHLLSRIEACLIASNIPSVTWNTVKASGHLLAALAGAGQSFLMVQNSQVSKFRFYIGAQTYGAHLDVVEYITVEPGIIGRFFSKAIYHDPTALYCNLSVFQNRELEAFISVVHQMCVEPAITELTNLKKGHGHTPQAKGYLGFW